MVGPGQSYAKMITGDFIAGRDESVTDVPDPSEMF
jgi:hypothetical protein